MERPRARNDGVLTTELDDELIVYDSERKWAHSLNATAASVWRHCDGRQSVSDLQRAVSVALGSLVDEAAVELALRQLDQAHLLVERFAGSGPSVSRREMLRKARRLGVAAVAAPVVLSALVPQAAAAQSCIGLNQICQIGGTPCCTGLTCQLPNGSKVHICLS
jgi:hypothetical protein